MGSGDSTVTYKYPPPTKEERELQSYMMNYMFPSIMEQNGYIMDTTEHYKEGYKDDRRWQDAKYRAENWDQSGEKRKADLDVMEKVEEEYNNWAGGKTTEPTMRRKESEAAEYARATYGADSSQYKEAHDEWQAGLIEDEERLKEIQTKYQDVTLKFLNGDFSITPEQKALIKENMEPQYKAVQSMFDELEGKSKAEQNRIYGNYITMVEDQGMDPQQALKAAGEIMAKGEDPMSMALTKVIDVKKQLMKMGIEDATGEVTRNIASRAAVMGRTPGDPEYQKELQDNVGRMVQQGELGLAEMEAGGRLQIAREKEQRFQQLEERRFATTQAKGAANLSLEEQAANLRWQVGAGMPPQQVGLGMNVSQFNEALNQQRVANLQSASQVPMGMMGQMQQLRSQPSQATTSKPTNWLDVLSTVGIMAASIYTGGAAGAAYGSMASYYKSKAMNQP